MKRQTVIHVRCILVYITMGFEQMCSHFYDYCYVKINVIDFIVATDVIVNADDDDDGCYA